MNGQADAGARGLFDQRYIAFTEPIGHLHSRLHRYRSRMKESVMAARISFQTRCLEHLVMSLPPKEGLACC
jgi:hypothetical protein